MHVPGANVRLAVPTIKCVFSDMINHILNAFQNKKHDHGESGDAPDVAAANPVVPCCRAEPERPLHHGRRPAIRHSGLRRER